MFQRTIGPARVASTVAAAVIGLATIAPAVSATMPRGTFAVRNPRAVAHPNVRVHAAQAFATLHSFAQTDGSFPIGALDLAIRYANRTFTTSVYGVTSNGGSAADAGVVYDDQLQSGAFSLTHAFVAADGTNPGAGLDNNASDYLAAGAAQIGTTQYAGTTGNGTLYVITSAGKVSVVHNFTGAADGANPVSRPVAFTDGNFYGTTPNGGTYGYGTVFKYSPKSGAFTTIHEFTGTGADGGSPVAGLSIRIVRSSNASGARVTQPQFSQMANSSASIDKVLYGTASVGGAGNAGTVFSIAPNGTFATLHSFVGNPDGSTPSADLTPDTNGNLYGTALNGGSSGAGTVFAIKPGNAFAVVADFYMDANGNFPAGASPLAPITVAFNGALYGSTSAGGANDLGELFKISGGTFSDIHDFASADGASPQGKMVDGLDGNLYGTTNLGGANGFGTLFRIAE